jgi:hypothetical protein
LLPDDGIIDPIAVEIAATGQRPVRLTAAERREAAARILAEGGSPWLISRRLKMTPEAARSLAASIAESMAPEIKAPEIKAPETKEPERG